MVAATPIEAPPLSLRRVELDRRTDCARVSTCVMYAAKQGWRGFVCSYCAVRETSKTDAPMRTAYDGVLTWPDVRG